MQVFSTPPAIAFRRPWPTTRRGFKLWLISVVLGARGFTYATEPASRSGAFQFPFDWMTTQGWGVLVVLVCGVAVFSSYCHLGRDRFGYVAMTCLSGGWALCYGYGYAFRGAGEPAIQGLLSFLLIVVLLMHCAGDPEYQPGERRSRRGRR
ncbi:conserved membrane hypothetical protein [Nocardioides sp. AX2bis]|nr:conserved membrane hypothetical protein [Nocardioides sp. AX2bis]